MIFLFWFIHLSERMIVFYILHSEHKTILYNRRLRVKEACHYNFICIHPRGKIYIIAINLLNVGSKDVIKFIWFLTDAR